LAGRLTRDLRGGRRGGLLAQNFGLAATVASASCLLFIAFHLLYVAVLKPATPFNSREMVLISDDGPSVKIPHRASPGNYFDWRSSGTTVESLSLVGRFEVAYRFGNQASSAANANVSPAAFKLSGVRMLAGRPFADADERMQNGRVAILDSRFVMDKLGIQDWNSVLNKTIILDEQPYVIAGIVDRRSAQMFDVVLGIAPDIYDVVLDTPFSRRTRRNAQWTAVGRISNGSSLAQAQAQFASISSALGREYPRSNGELRIAVEPFDLYMRQGGLRLSILFGGTFLLFLLTILSVGNLYLASALRRQREFAIQLSLGASVLRLSIRILLHSGLTAAGAVSIGFLFAYWIRATGGLFPALITQGLGIRWYAPPEGISSTELAYAAIVWLIFLIASAAPPLALLASSRNAVARVLARSAAHSMPQGLRRTLSGLLVAQMVLTTLVSAVTGLAVARLLQLRVAPLGFSSKNLFTIRAAYRSSKNPADWTRYYESVLDRLRQVSGITDATSTYPHPLTQRATLEFSYPGSALTHVGDSRQAAEVYIGTSYPQTLRIPLTEGQPGDRFDLASRSRHILINRAMADRYSLKPGQKILSFKDELEVVGILENTRSSLLDRADIPTFYRQTPFNLQYFTIRHDGSRSDVMQAATRAILEVDRQVAVEAPQPIEEQLQRSLDPHRSLAWILAPMGAGALLFTIVSVVSLVSSTIAWRRRELGLRLALGASPNKLRTQITAEHFFLAVAASVIGWILLAWLSRLLALVLGGTGELAGDAIPLAAWFGGLIASLLCLISATAIGWIASRSVQSIEPATDLRAE
jgi:predicted permease